MIDDHTRSYFAQFVMNMASAESMRQQLAPHGMGVEISASDAFKHRRLVRIRDLLVKYPIIGAMGRSYVQDGYGLPDSDKERITITNDILRALAHDAMNNVDTPSTEWWYDPSAPDGLSEYFPGKSMRPGEF